MQLGILIDHLAFSAKSFRGQTLQGPNLSCRTHCTAGSPTGGERCRGWIRPVGRDAREQRATSPSWAASAGSCAKRVRSRRPRSTGATDSQAMSSLTSGWFRWIQAASTIAAASRSAGHSGSVATVILHHRQPQPSAMNGRLFRRRGRTCAGAPDLDPTTCKPQSDDRVRPSNHACRVNPCSATSYAPLL